MYVNVERCCQNLCETNSLNNTGSGVEILASNFIMLTTSDAGLSVEEQSGAGTGGAGQRGVD